MYLINDELIKDLSPFIKDGGLDSHINKVAMSIAKSYEHMKIGVLGHHTNLADKTNKELTTEALKAVRDPQSPHFENAKELNDRERIFTYLKHTEPCVDLAMSIQIRIPNPVDYNSKHLAQYNSPTTCASHWQWFFDWLEPQNIFKEIGRVIVFINERGQQTVEHRDYLDGVSRKDQFILFTSPRKRFWLQNDGDRCYAVSNAILFDNANFHGSEPPKYITWSLRVDGVFTDEWMKKAGIYNHYNEDIQ